MACLRKVLLISGSNASTVAALFCMLTATWIVTAPLVVSQSTSLLLVQMLIKHGDRAPHILYPTDPNPPEAWPQGLDMLTQRGKRQHYALGTFLRNFYFGFVTSNPTEIMVNSTGYDRCLQGALTTVASFYAPTSKQWVVEDGLDWQPVVVHYRDVTSDKYLSVNVGCPKIKKERDQQFNSSDFLSEFGKHHKMIEALKLYGGFSSVGWNDVLLFRETVSRERKHGLIVPEWIDLYWNELTDLADLIFSMLINTTAQHRLGSGPLLEKMLENMDNKVEGKDDQLKVHMYSLSWNIAGVMEALGLYESSPPSGACLLFELHKTLGGPAVRLLYTNSSTVEDISTIHPHLLKFQGCGEFCPLQHFRQLVQPIIPKDWDKECQITD